MGVKKTLFTTLVLVALMLKSLLSAFGMDGKEKSPTVYPRQIDLSGNVFSFAMREDFSRDMPAEDMIEKLDLEGSAALKRDGYITLMRRWWDLKEPGFFGKDQGSVMMAITLRKKPENQAGIIKTKENDFHKQRYREHNKEATTKGDAQFVVHVPNLAWQVGEDTYSSYELISINSRQWASTGTVQGRQSNNIYALPLDEQHYLEIEFALMPSDNVAPYNYIGIATPRMDAIVKTFIMRYASGNAIDEITEKYWMNRTFLGEMEAKHLLRFDD